MVDLPVTGAMEKKKSDVFCEIRFEISGVGRLEFTLANCETICPSRRFVRLLVLFKIQNCACVDIRRCVRSLLFFALAFNDWVTILISIYKRLIRILSTRLYTVNFSLQAPPLPVLLSKSRSLPPPVSHLGNLFSVYDKCQDNTAKPA